MKLSRAVEIVAKDGPDPMILGDTCWAANECDGQRIAREQRANGYKTVIVIPFWLARLDEKRARGEYPQYREN